MPNIVYIDHLGSHLHAGELNRARGFSIFCGFIKICNLSLSLSFFYLRGLSHVSRKLIYSERLRASRNATRIWSRCTGMHLYDDTVAPSSHTLVRARGLYIYVYRHTLGVHSRRWDHGVADYT